MILGVDGGKSKTICLVADDTGTIRGWGRGGCSDKSRVPLERAVAEISHAVTQALMQAEISREQVEVGCFGLAGADWQEDFEIFHRALAREHLAREILVKNDAQIALRANTASGIGIVLSAGTHCSTAIRTPNGTEWFSGWYSIQGAGGAEAGRRVLWAVLNAEDGRGEPTILTDLVLEAKKFTHPLDLLRGIANGEIDEAFEASLAPLLFKAHARFHDAVAARIIADLGNEMSRWVIGLVRKYGLQEIPVQVFLTGGLFKSESKLLFESLYAAAHAYAPLVEFQRAAYEPALGALLYAFEKNNDAVADAVRARLQDTAPPAEFFRTG